MLILINKNKMRLFQTITKPIEINQYKILNSFIFYNKYYEFKTILHYTYYVLIIEIKIANKICKPVVYSIL